MTIICPNVTLVAKDPWENYRNSIKINTNVSNRVMSVCDVCTMVGVTAYGHTQERHANLGESYFILFDKIPASTKELQRRRFI